MAQSTVKITVDVREFTEFTRKAPGIMDGLVKESLGRGAAKMRKEFHQVIDRGSWAQLQETPQYRSKYSKPLQMLKAMIRYRLTGGYKKVTATIGIFAGRAGRSTISNAYFRAKYGVTVARFGQLSTYGGKLRVTPAARRLFVQRGFHLSKRTNAIVFPARNWYTPCRWKDPGVIIPYITTDLNKRIQEKLTNGKFYKKLR